MPAASRGDNPAETTTNPFDGRVWLAVVALSFVLAFAMATSIFFVYGAIAAAPARAFRDVTAPLAPVVAPVVAPDPIPQTNVTAPDDADAFPVEAPSVKPPSYLFLKTHMLGSKTAGRPFERISAIGEPIVGFRVTLARSQKDTVLRDLEPIYASDDLLATPSMIVARPGYVVGGVRVAGDRQINAIRIVFMRQLESGVDPADSYQSDWQGDWARWSSYLLGGNGDVVTGVYGHRGTNIGALGLILRQTTASPAAN